MLDPSRAGDPGRPLRILHVGSTYPPHVVGGAEKVVEMLAEAQAARGLSVASAYLSKTPEPEGQRHGVVTLPQANRNLLWMDDVLKAPRPARTASKLGQLLNVAGADDFERAMARFAPDVVHTHSMVELPPMIWRRAAASGARVVHTLHDYDLLCSRATLFRNGRSCDRLHPPCRVTAAWKKRFARDIHAVAAVSLPVLEVHRRFGALRDLPDDRARVIWNAVDRPSRPRPRRGGDLVFGFLGRLVPEKGLGVLLDACHQLAIGGWRLRVAGRAQEGDDAWRRRADGLPVEFLGFTDPSHFLSSIDILIVPSIWREPFGLTVAEAFAHHLPVIGARIGAVADLVGTIGSDWLVPPGDEGALAGRMTQAITQGRDALPPAAAFAPLLKRLSPAHMVDAYQDIYAAALAPSPA